MEIKLNDYQEDNKNIISNYVIITFGATVFTYLLLLRFKYALENDWYSFNGILYATMIITIFGFAKLAYYYLHKGEEINEFLILTHAKRNYNGRDILLMFLILYPVAIYIKFKTLHEHLLDDHQNENEFPPNSKFTLISIIPMFILLNMASSYELIREEFTAAILSLIILIVFQSLMYLEIQWNKTFNTHIDNHMTSLS